LRIHAGLVLVEVLTHVATMPGAGRFVLLLLNDFASPPFMVLLDWSET
jgi:hypothetical protein